VNDQAEQDWIVATFANFGGTPRSLWIGLTDQSSEGIFSFWINGEPIGFTFWWPGEPNDCGGLFVEDYVHMFPSTDARYPHWNDIRNDGCGQCGECFAPNGVVEVVLGPAISCFTSPSSWATYDYGADPLGCSQDPTCIHPDGYANALFDGRYVYFIPDYDGSFHGEFLRFDTTGGFGNATSWVTYDPGENGVGSDPDGYVGAVFDGQFVYFVPQINGSEYSGEVLRFDTTGGFTDAASWDAYDPGANGVGTDPDGFNGGVFDGRYVYFAPVFNGTEPHGEVLRYDTTSPFGDVLSWAAYDAGANGVGVDPDGYVGGAFDGRYIYFSPQYNGTEFHGEVLRYDTTNPFNNAASWATYDPGANGVGTDPDGYYGAVFDGRYVYFTPNLNGTDRHGEVLRYDTTGAFANPASWATYDYGSDPLGCAQDPNCNDPDGYDAVGFDGRYVYFSPYYNGTGNHGEVLRYDTSGDFANALSWSTYDPGANGVGTDPDGYDGVVFDGRYMYFVPFDNGSNHHGEVLRYDTRGGACPAEGGDDTCHNGSMNTLIPCSTDDDCTPPAVCGNKRYITAKPANLEGGGNASIQVEIVSMPECIGGANAGRACSAASHCPGGMCGPSPRQGEIWWAGAEQPIPDPPLPALRGAMLMCEASPTNAQVWTTGDLHLFGTSIVPASRYNVRMCDENGASCSPPRLVATSKWGDVLGPFGGGAQPNFTDINSIVQKFIGIASAPSTPRADLVAPGNFGEPNKPNQVVNFADVAADIAAFMGTPYPYTVPACP